MADTKTNKLQTGAASTGVSDDAAAGTVFCRCLLASDADTCLRLNCMRVAAIRFSADGEAAASNLNAASARNQISGLHIANALLHADQLTHTRWVD